MIDSSALIPGGDAAHPLHARASRGFLKLEREDVEAVVTDHVLGESFTVIRRLGGDAGAAAFVREFVRCERAGIFRLEMANRSDLDAAPGVALQVASKRFSFVDALNVVVARRLGIRVLFGFDRHFFTRFRFRRWA